MLTHRSGQAMYRRIETGVRCRVLARLAVTDRLVGEIVFGGACLRSADHRLQPSTLLTRNQPQRAACWTRKHSPVRVICATKIPSLFEEKQRTRLHLLRDPLFQKTQLSDHRYPFRDCSFLRDDFIRVRHVKPRLCDCYTYSPPCGGQTGLHYLWCTAYPICAQCQLCFLGSSEIGSRGE